MSTYKRYYFDNSGFTEYYSEMIVPDTSKRWSLINYAQS